MDDLTNIICIEKDCRIRLKIFKRDNDILDEAYVCKGWLKQYKFVNGNFYKGDYGGIIIAEGIIDFAVDFIRDNPGIFNHENRACNVDNERFYVIKVDEKLKNIRKEALKNRKISDIFWHENIAHDLIGPAYCKDHAERLEYICPECNEEIVSRMDINFNRFLIMDDEEFLEMFCTSSIYG